jgi:hypothetical protein
MTMDDWRGSRNSSPVSGTDAWPVGDSQLNAGSGPLRTLILHWNGTAWSVR